MEEVWSYNFEKEMCRIEEMVVTYPYISIDTEFPGFLQNSPRDASELQRYRDLKFNVDRLKIIQLGLSLSDANGNRPTSGGVWQFNFADFDPTTDLQVPGSTQFLRRHGLNLEKFQVLGIDTHVFSLRFIMILRHNPRLKWITFHGVYDLAYMMKLIRKEEMPSTQACFLKAIANLFRRVYDVKYMAVFCLGLDPGALGLKKLANILKVEPIGPSHQAGSDSLMTTCLFWKIVKKVQFQFVQSAFEGFLYGITPNVHTSCSRPLCCLGYPIHPQIFPPQFPVPVTYYGIIWKPTLLDL